MINTLLNTATLTQTKGDDVIKKIENRSDSASFSDALKARGSAKADNISAKSEKKDKKLWDTCIDFESIYVGQMFSAMRETVHKGDLLHGGRAEEIFEDFLYDEYAEMTSKNSNLGIAEMLYKQLS